MSSSRFPPVSRLVLSAVLLAAAGLSSPALPEAVAQTRPQVAFQIIVNRKNPTAAVSRDLVAQAFLKRTSRWNTGAAIRPVDLDADSTTRRAFSRTVLARSVSAVRNYWRQRLFSGRDIPPPELDSDAAVARYVAKHEGAIGYVTAGSQFADVKVVDVK